jgi:DNA-binding MarR family transcriptional regulator
VSAETDVERLLSAAARLNRWVNRYADLELPSAQLRTLALVGDLAPVRVGDLAAADGISQPTMTAALGRLESSGYVARAADDSDARATLVDLTPAGRRALGRARAQRTRILSQALTGLPAARTKDVTTGAEALSRLVEALGVP